MKQHLVISAIGTDQPGIVNRLSRAAYDAGCNIVDSRMAVLGGEFALVLLTTGEEAEVAALEAALPQLQTELDLKVLSKRTRARRDAVDHRPYRISAVAIDHPGIVYQLAEFFSSRNINIEDLSSERYAAAHTGTPMFAIEMTIKIPTQTKIAALRTQFLGFCDELNVDASFEPIKT